MATSTSNPEAPATASSRSSGSRLSKEERRELLARIERESSRGDSPERLLQRAEQALVDGHRAQADRLARQLERSSPDLVGLDHLRRRLTEAEKREKLQANARKAEEMLVRYVEQRKKSAAALALEALKEIAPEHPRLEEYGIWVHDLDKEVAQQRQLDEELASGRLALQAGEIARARHHLERLRRIDATAPTTVSLAAEIEQAEAGEAESADIAGIKRRFEEHLAALRVAEAESEIYELARHAVPKVTLDRLRQRLDGARLAAREQRELTAFEESFHAHVAAHRWQQARDVAQSVGRRFPGHPRAAGMFNEVAELEAEDRARESTRQGVAMLERFIAEGRRGDAELALKLLEGKIEPDRFAAYEEKVRAL